MVLYERTLSGRVLAEVLVLVAAEEPGSLDDGGGERGREAALGASLSEPSLAREFD